MKDINKLACLLLLLAGLECPAQVTPKFPLDSILSAQLLGVEKTETIKIDGRFGVMIWSSSTNWTMCGLFPPQYSIIAKLTDANGVEVKPNFPDQTITYDPKETTALGFMHKWHIRSHGLDRNNPLQYGYFLQVNRLFDITNNGPFKLTVRAQVFTELPNGKPAVLLSAPEVLTVKGRWSDREYPAGVAAGLGKQLKFTLCNPDDTAHATSTFNASDLIQGIIFSQQLNMIWVPYQPYVMSMTDQKGNPIRAKFVQDYPPTIPHGLFEGHSYLRMTKGNIWCRIEQPIVPDEDFEIPTNGVYHLKVQVWIWKPISRTNVQTVLSEPLTVSVVKK